MGYEGENRREHSRVSFPCKIMISSPVRLLVSHTENLSEGGMRVVLEEKLSPYTMVGIEVFFEKNKPIKCKGKIAWVKEMVNPIAKTPTMFETGIKFIELNDCDKEYIKKLIKAITPEQKDDSGENK
ncbi:MAG: PilZ domain-containing protein [Candidatus Omnitrophica bacterium]|nr:PilZ domain-containing protein [Candidatus Omnitrophota bacterium]